MKTFVILTFCLLLGGCSSNGELQRIMEEKGSLEVEHDKLKKELLALKQDWTVLQDNDSSVKLIQELREKLREAAEYKSATQKQLDSNIQTINFLRAENSTLKKENKQASKTLNELQNKLAAYQLLERAAIRQRAKGSVYAGIGGRHWIREATPGAGIIVLEDGSVWEVNPMGRITTCLWLPTARITVLENPTGFLPYLLVNTDQGEKAEAKYIGQQ